MPRPLVIIESPYSGNRVRNNLYLRRCIQHSISLGELPFASHRMYTDALDDTVEEERKLGMELGFDMIIYASFIAVYSDYGESLGMLEGIKFALKYKKLTMYRTIGPNL